MLRDNFIKTTIGLVFNIVLLWFIHSFDIIAIAVIQTICFALLYTLIDKIILLFKKSEKNETNN